MKYTIADQMAPILDNEHVKLNILDQGGKLYLCSICDEFFENEKKYIKHCATHTGQSSHQCDFCGKVFKERRNLKAHLNIHTGNRPYKCTQCPKSFMQHGHLKDHLKIHTGEKPFKCSHCGKSFRQYGQLRNHVRTHSGEKPFKCGYCGRGFKQVSHLKNHNWYGSKSNKCIPCGVIFKCFIHRRDHRQAHTQKKIYETKQQNTMKIKSDINSLKSNLNILGDEDLTAEIMQVEYELRNTSIVTMDHHQTIKSEVNTPDDNYDDNAVVIKEEGEMFHYMPFPCRAQSLKASALLPTQERKNTEERIETKIEKLWKQLEKELEKRWLIVETDKESKRTVKTFTLDTILQIIKENKVVNKSGWTLLIKAHLEKLIEMGHGNKELEVKIYMIPYKQDEASVQGPRKNTLFWLSRLAKT